MQLYHTVPTAVEPHYSTQSATLSARNLPTLLSLDFDVAPLYRLTPLGGANACPEFSHKVQPTKGYEGWR
jgi:hypothetical protein